MCTYLGESVPVRGNSRCRGPEAELYLDYCRVTRAQQLEEREGGGGGKQK